MGIAATAASLAATGLSAGSSIAAGYTAARNARRAGQSEMFSRFYDSEQAKIAAQVGELRATQTDTAMRRQTEGAMANIDAVAALTGAADFSPSQWAVRNRYENLADEARTTATSNLRMDAAAKRNAAMLYAMSGMNAMRAADENAATLEMNGILGGAGALFKAAFYKRPDVAYG